MDGGPESDAGLEALRSSLCDEFSAVSGAERGVSQHYLSRNDWHMERALNSFFDEDMKAAFDEAQSSPERPVSPTAESKGLQSVECIDLTGDDAVCSSTTADVVDSAAQRDSTAQEDRKLSLITWNVDGLDTDNLAERARGLCSYLVLYTPDVVFLQELIPPYVKYLKKRAVSYIIIEGNEDGYFTGIMLKKSRVKLLKSEIVPFPTTQMLRNLLVAEVKFLDWDVCLMTSHLESCKEQAQERMNQLSEVFKRMKEAPDNVTILFGGDTNLRDPEVSKVGGLPDGACDVWEHLGKQEHCRYTWDTKANSNKCVPYVSRCRFDRVYLRPARQGPRVVAEHMTLIGMEKLDCGRYTSDHWGIYCTFTTGS
ncbi:tyrosyl-DNA phosphodiesterase 2-like [Scleropages formosus]|uniref:Tyrosyl-DNA phosphodiesterase 2 n=1 Tax=Scleropages formosus TaxID=113540 RepID=A0A0P7V880_SCLFO|nr:tyrosyl-DNA phosphodiesterase 2-like [Scleropages formosus]